MTFHHRPARVHQRAEAYLLRAPGQNLHRPLPPHRRGLADHRRPRPHRQAVGLGAAGTPERHHPHRPHGPDLRPGLVTVRRVSRHALQGRNAEGNKFLCKNRSW